MLVCNAYELNYFAINYLKKMYSYNSETSIFDYTNS